jgi:DNA-binding CsgD family transcriptional regulator
MVLVLEGEAGSGKTTLARHALDQLGADATVVTVAADELAAEVPLAMLRSWVGAASVDSPFEAGMALLDRFGALTDGPLLAVLVEDLHFADPVSQAALLTAVRRLDHERLLMLVTTRPAVGGRDAGWERLLGDPERALRIGIGALAVGEVADLASATGTTLTARAARRLHAHTAGNALYVATLLRESTAAQLNAAGEELPVPRSLAATVAERVGLLPDGPRDLLGALAVLNAPTPLPRLARVAGVEAAAEAVDAAVGTGYVTWRPQELMGPLQFDHPLYRAAVYHALPAQRRQELHLASAAVTDHLSSLAHRVAAADRLDEALADELDAAAAEDATPPRQGAQLLRWSSALTTDRASVDRRLLRAAQLLLGAGDFTTLNGMREQLDACASGPLRALVLGQLAWHEGDPDVAERLLSEAARADDPELATHALVELTTAYNAQSRGQAAVDAAVRALALGCRPSLEQAAWSARAVGIGLLEGAAAGLDAIAGRLPDDPADVDRNDAAFLSVRGMLHHYASRHVAAVADLREVTRRLRPDINSDHLRRSYVHLAQSQFLIGAWDDAIINANIALDLLTEEDHRWERAQAHQAASYVYAGRGQWVRAQQHVDAARTGARTPEGYFGAQLAAVAIQRARNEPEAIVATLGELVGGGDRVPMITTLGWWTPYIHAFIETGRLDAAEEHIARFEGAARVRRIVVASRTTALRAELAAARGDLGLAQRLFSDAISLISADDPVLDVATIHRDHGRLLRRIGHRHAALAALRAARSVLGPLGAEPYLAPVDAELAAAGLARPQRRRGSPLDLTPREQDVATLAGRGLTNKEIAADLYISAKAVEYHLGNIYGKLGINSRRQLRDLVAT